MVPDVRTDVTDKCARIVNLFDDGLVSILCGSPKIMPWLAGNLAVRPDALLAAKHVIIVDGLPDASTSNARFFPHRSIPPRCIPVLKITAEIDCAGDVTVIREIAAPITGRN